MKTTIKALDLILQIDPELMTITIMQGSAKTKAEVISKINRANMLALINQMAIGLDGCVEPIAYDILEDINNGFLENAISIAHDWMSLYDNYIVYKAI